MGWHISKEKGTQTNRRHEDSENLKDIKATQEHMWRELGRRLDGFPRSPFALTPARKVTMSYYFVG